jgi:5-methylthioadenosine/S-adenosylhomocysteine deaminase
LILVDLTALNLSPAMERPVRNIVLNLVCAACAAYRDQWGSGHEVRTVMVAGKIVVRDGVVLTADEEAVRAGAQMLAEALARRVAADPVHRRMALMEAMEVGWL